MISRLQNHLSGSFSFLLNKKLLLAVSGGVDSMVLADLFRLLPFEIAIAHCNFNLRDKESAGDQHFIENYAVKNKIPIFVAQFDTLTFATDYKLSIQVAARQLRYNWFYELLENENFDYVLTAHHADDNLETFLINLSRGTGLEGLTGIPPQNDKIIRPLLVFSRGEIENYAEANHIQWREDSSNASDKYLRNKLRHQVVPVFKELNPSLLDSFQNTVQYLGQAQSLVDDASRIIYRKVVTEEDNQKRINMVELLQLPNYRAYLQQWLKPFGFSAWDDIYDLANSQSGKQVFSENFRVLKDRDCLILCPKNIENEYEEYLIQEGQKVVNFPLKLSFCKVTGISGISNTTIFVDAGKLQFPLVLRKWKTGDVFQPLGMGGRSKKVSKLFKDEKLSLIEKEKTWLLCSAEKIVWIIRIRQDERFKVEKENHNILKIALL
jgi:tRNA(Ile)-lysidine synthase